MKPITIIHPVFAALMTVGLAACQIDESLDPGIDQEFRTSRGCQGCNSPIVNGSEVNELDLSGAPNLSGMELLGIIDPNTQVLHAVDVNMNNHEFRVWSGQYWISDVQLIGWELLLKDASDAVYNLRIDTVQRWPTWSNLYVDAVVVYGISYWKDDHFAPICPTEDVDDQFVTVVADETYDRKAIKVVPGQGSRFSLACANEAAFKMKMLGYYPYSLEADDPDLRQATLKMLTADYCGLGISFTEAGTPVDWLNDGKFDVPQWNNPPSDDDLEAIWDENGAICLNNPRLALLEEVYYDCGDDAPPPCDEELLQTPHEWTTWRVP